MTKWMGLPFLLEGFWVIHSKSGWVFRHGVDEVEPLQEYALNIALKRHMGIKNMRYIIECFKWYLELYNEYIIYICEYS